MVDKHRARLRTRERPALSKRDGTQIVIVADAGEDKIAALRRLSGGRRARSAVRGDPLGGGGRGSVVDDDVMACPLQVTGHRKTHDAQSPERNLAKATTPIQ